MTTKIQLTKSQMIKIGAEISKARKAANEEKPGMLLAQIGTTGKTKVGFVSHEHSLKIQEVLGGEIGKTGKL